MILADKIMTERKKNGWSQEELADRLRVSRQSVSKWEGAQSVPDLQRILEMSRLFGVTTDYLLKDELEQPDPSAAGATADATDPVDGPARTVTLEEASAFLDARRRTAPGLARGVALCVIAPAPLIALSAAADAGMGLTENAAVGIGLLALLLFVTAAVIQFISCGLKNKPYEYLSTGRIDTAYGVDGMVRAAMQRTEGQHRRQLVTGIVLCILGVCPIFIGLIWWSENGFLTVVTVAVLLLLEALGAMCLVRTGSIQSGFHQLLQTEDYTPENKRRQRLNAPISASYWLVATAVYLAYSFITMNWAFSWIIWPVAGVLFPAVIAIVNAVRRR